MPDDGLYFQGVGASMVEDFGTEAVKYNEEIIILPTQLVDLTNINFGNRSVWGYNKRRGA